MCLINLSELSASFNNNKKISKFLFTNLQVSLFHFAVSMTIFQAIFFGRKIDGDSTIT